VGSRPTPPITPCVRLRHLGVQPEAFHDANAFDIPDDPIEREAMLREVGETYPHILASWRSGEARRAWPCRTGTMTRREAVAEGYHMKVLISADMEGVCGVTEAHDGMRNLLPEDLHEDVRFITGSDKALGMMQGIAEADVGAVFFVGYHAKAGTPHAPLAHTWTGYVHDVRLAGRSTGEFGINAAIAGHFGASVTLVTGDDKAVAQVRDLLGEQVVGVVVKEGYTTFSAIHLHPLRAQGRIREGAERAVRQAARASPWRLPPDCRVEIDFDHQARAQACLFVPGVERAGDRTVAFTARDALTLNDTFTALMTASAVTFSP
jgi:D-amino peptidase